MREAERLARREAIVLRHLQEFTSGYFIDSGDLDGGGPWLTVRWLDDITPDRLFAPARHGDDSPARRASILHAATGIADRLARSTSWDGSTPTSNPPIFSSDRPPSTSSTSSLPKGRGRSPQRSLTGGGMVHFTAPETATHLLATPDDQTVTIDQPAEVYALAAALHLAWTGLPPCPPAYTHDQAPWLEKLKDIAQGRRHDLATIRPWPWPAFEHALRHALNPDPQDRTPSMARLREALQA